MMLGLYLSSIRKSTIVVVFNRCKKVWENYCNLILVSEFLVWVTKHGHRSILILTKPRKNLHASYFYFPTFGLIDYFTLWFLASIQVHYIKYDVGPSSICVLSPNLNHGTHQKKKIRGITKRWMSRVYRLISLLSLVMKKIH